MVRPRASERLGDVVEQATRVFMTKGYRRAQMADVTDSLGLSAGAIYRYVESKEALFDLLVRFAAAPDDPPSDLELPVPTPEPGATVAFLKDVLSRELADDFEALETSAELESILGRLYASAYRYRRGIKLVERSALDWPELAVVWFGEMRGRLIDRLAAYLERGGRQGRLRSVPDPAAAARLILETIAFFAIHRHGDPFPTPMDDSTARETVLDGLMHAYLKETDS